MAQMGASKGMSGHKQVQARVQVGTSKGSSKVQSRVPVDTREDTIGCKQCVSMHKYHEQAEADF